MGFGPDREIKLGLKTFLSCPPPPSGDNIRAIFFHPHTSRHFALFAIIRFFFLKKIALNLVAQTEDP